MQHPDEGTIHAWLDGALSDDEGRAIEAHVAQCADCRAAVIEAHGLIAGSTRILLALDSVPGGVLPAAAAAPIAGQESVAIRRRPLWRSTGWRAAAAIVLVGSVSWLVTRSNVPADVTAASPVQVTAATAGGPAAEQTVVASAANGGSPNATLSTAPRGNSAPPSARTPNAKPPNATSPDAIAPDVARRAAEVANAVAETALPRAAPTGELGRVSAADALELQGKAAGVARPQVAVAAAEPSAPGARKLASPTVGMMQETVAPMGKASASSAVVSMRPVSAPLTGCYALETSSPRSSSGQRADAARGALLPTRLQLIGAAGGSGAERGTVLAPPPGTGDAAARVRGEWASPGANLLELRIGEGARSVTATLSVHGDSVTGQARADSGAVTDQRTAAVQGRRTSCKAP